MEHLYDALILSTSGIGKGRLERLKQFFGDARTVWQADSAELRGAGLLPSRELENLLQQRLLQDPETVFASWQTKQIGICSQEDNRYPMLLRRCYNPPPFLFYRGQLPEDAACLAVVGSRRATPYGRNVARSFSERLSQYGVTIVSGAARGIDAAAHEGALLGGNPTIAVLGCGVDVAYPPENRRLIEQIAQTGCVISEYPPGTPPTAGRFPARNRIVAGMSLAVLVVEAAEKSGALITADLALEENRDVYAIPGSVFSDASKGTHRLIQQGARLIGSVEDILQEMGLARNEARQRAPMKLTAAERRVLDALSSEEARPVEELIRELDMEAADIQVLLLQMELSGQVEKDRSMSYIKVARE
jgi:DNA processing protein